MSFYWWMHEAGREGCIDVLVMYAFNVDFMYPQLIIKLNLFIAANQMTMNLIA